MKKFAIVSGPSMWDIISNSFAEPDHRGFVKRSIGLFSVKPEGGIYLTLKTIDFQDKPRPGCRHQFMILHGTCERHGKTYQVKARYSPECGSRCGGKNKGEIEVDHRAIHVVSVLDMF